MSKIQKLTVSKAEYSRLVREAVKSMKQSAAEVGERMTVAQVIDDARDLVATFYIRAEA